MAVANRTELADYCLRRLGAPVIEINVDDDQVSDRIDDALQFWNEYHFDGTERMYLKTQVVASFITLTTNGNQSFQYSEKITGGTSQATAVVYNLPTTILNRVIIFHLSGAFTAGETITGATSGATAVVSAFSLGNWDQGYFTTTDAITGVVRIFPVGSGGIGGSVNNIFDVVYQFRLTDMYDLLTTDLIYYQQMKQHLETLDMLLPGQRTIRFNRKQNRVYVDCDWYTVFVPGDYVIVECFAITNPADFPKVYDDLFLKRYTTALIKRQWGSNLQKFQGIQLPGGVVLNGDKIYIDATNEILKIEEEMQARFELPPSMMFG